MALDVIETVDSYTEVSPSGKGLRIFLEAPGVVLDKSAYYTNNRDLKLEVYIEGSTFKFLTITGNVLRDRPVAARSAEIQTVLDKYMLKKKASAREAMPGGKSILTDDEVITKAHAAVNGERFGRLWAGDWEGYPSQSEADQGLCNLLAFWTRRDLDQMDRLFRQSGLMREKWDARDDYRSGTLQKAIADQAEVYDPGSPEQRSKRADKAFRDGLTVNPLEDLKRYSFNDRGNGYVFADAFRNLCRYSPEAKEWFYYDGRRWKKDTGGLLSTPTSI